MPEASYTILIALYLPVMFLGTTLNLILLVTMLSNQKLRTDPRNSFILALAFSDFFLCNFTSPLTLWATLEGHWPLGMYSQPKNVWAIRISHWPKYFSNRKSNEPYSRNQQLFATRSEDFLFYVLLRSRIGSFRHHCIA